MKAGFSYGAYDDERDIWKGSSYISGLAETGYALIVDEKKIAKDKTVEWPYSYYRLFTAKYTQLLPSADKRLQKLTYSHDNREQIKNDLSLKAKDSQGYECFLEWIPADSLRSNRHINRRYASILDIIDRL